MTIRASMDLSAPTEDISLFKYRLETFSKWEGKVSKTILARTGFYYSGIEDLVICYGCKLQLKGWETSDVPFEEHVKFEPECPALPERVFCGIEWMNCTSVMYPKFKSTRARKKSFWKYPISCKIRHKLFIDAGFFCAGVDDTVICFTCGVGLKNWSSEDDPLKMHTRFFHHCPVVKKKNKTNVYRSNPYFKTGIKSISKEERSIIEKNLGLDVKCKSPSSD